MLVYSTAPGLAWGYKIVCSKTKTDGFYRELIWSGYHSWRCIQCKSAVLSDHVNVLSQKLLKRCIKIEMR